MSAYPNDPIVDRSSLRRIMEDFHDCSRVLRLRYHNGRKRRLVSPGNLQDLAKTFDGTWNEGLTEGEVIPYLVVEEVTWKVKGQGKYREQELPNPHCRMTRSGRITIKRAEGDGDPTY